MARPVPRLVGSLAVCMALGLVVHAGDQLRVEVTEDGLTTVELSSSPSLARLVRGGRAVPYPATPDWQNAFRIEVGGLVATDIDGDGDVDVVVGCYHSESYPPYPDWHNFIYRNEGGVLETTPSWTSSDQVSTTDVQVALINDDPYPDVFAANGDYAMAPSVIYFGTATGPSTTPGWVATDVTWTIYALPFDVDHDGDVDVVTANQGNSPQDPHRPLYMYLNDNGTLTSTPSWQSSEISIQNFLSFGDLDGDGWEDLAVSKWVNFESGVYMNNAGTLETVPGWTTGDADSDKGIGWADVDGNGWPDLALGHDPTTLYSNDSGTLTASWVSTATYFGHQDLRWEDIDGDKDPDLAEIHFSNGYVNIYVNNQGVLDSSPSWTYDCSGVGTAIAFGDIDGNGMPDLVVGNSGDVSLMVFYNQLEGPFFADDFESGTTSAWSLTVP